jgi:hypothetical protein
MNKEEATQICKDKIMMKYSSTYDDRPWETSGIDSYGTDEYRIEIHVWKGSPVKGYVVINNGTRTARAFSVNDKIIFKVGWR